jgi:hypothetical protein
VAVLLTSSSSSSSTSSGTCSSSTSVQPTKLAVLAATWGLSSRGSASRARRELLQRAARLASTPHNQAEAIDSLIRRCSPVIRLHGFAGLVALLASAETQESQ